MRRALAVLILALGLLAVAMNRSDVRVWEGGLPPPAGVRP